MEEKTLDELSFLVSRDKLRENSTLNSVNGQNILSLKMT